MPDHRRLSGQQRPLYGFTTTWENEAGQTISAHRKGPLRAMLRKLCDEVLAIDPGYRLVSYSTPDTIVVDLDGRVLKRESDGRPVPLPEAVLLGGIGRLELLHPRLRSRDQRRRIDVW
jgi:hypothetical protein